jgi:3-oxoacyl-[acyl-carrier protein] reductase
MTRPEVKASDQSWSLAGRTALVTGAGRGVGRATALLLHQRGAAVAAIDTDADLLEALSGEVHSAAVSVHQLDVANDLEVRAVVDSVIEEHGGLDIVVNNAGISAFAADIESATDSVWERTLAVNLGGIRNVSRAAIPHLREAGGGVIVNVSSVHAIATATGVAPYAASKGASLALTRSMAIDLAGSGVRVVGIMPGAIDTPMLLEYADRQNSSLEELGFVSDPNAIGRLIDPKEVAEVIAFVSSPAASALTGTSIAVDFGLLARL